ncbi:MAG: hypothetical protein ACREDH_14820 [Methylocella sp.]
MCKRAGRIEAATIVDHIVPHRGSPILFWDAANWQPLCAAHHSGEKQVLEAGCHRGGIKPSSAAFCDRF